MDKGFWLTVWPRAMKSQPAAVAFNGLSDILLVRTVFEEDMFIQSTVVNVEERLTNCD